MEPTMWERAVEGLISSGPLALVLALAIVVLWRDNQSLRKELLELLKQITKLGS